MVVYKDYYRRDDVGIVGEVWAGGRLERARERRT